MSVTIPLGCLGGDKCAIIDAADFPLVSQYNWRARQKKNLLYAQAKIAGRTIEMHRLILSPPNGAFVDHINGDGLDNRRENLRPCSRSQNAANSGARTGRFKGVSPTPSGKFRAFIHQDYRQIYLGIFRHEDDAACAYDAAAKELFGEFARLNFPDTRPRFPQVAARQGARHQPVPAYSNVIPPYHGEAK